MWEFAGHRTNPQPKQDPPSGRARLRKQYSPAASALTPLLWQSVRLPPLVIVSSLAINICGLALPLVVLQVFDRVLQHNAVSTLILLIAGLFGVVIAEMALHLARNQLVGRAALRECFDLQIQGASRFLNAPRSTAPSMTADRTFDAMMAMDEITHFLSGQGRLALLDFPFIFLFLGFIWAIGGSVVIMPMCLIVVFAAWIVWYSTSFKRALKEQVELDHSRYAFYAECLSGIATVKALAVEPQMQRRLEHLLQSSAPVNYDLVLRANRIVASGQLFANLTMISVVSVGGMLAIKGAITLGGVAACTLIANRVVQPVLRLIGVWGQMEAARFARDRFAQLLVLPPAYRLPRRPGAAEIELTGLRIGPDEQLSPQRTIHLKIEPGRVIGILSRVLAERIELLSILRGQTQPRGGSIFIDGLDLAGPEGQAALDGVFYLGSEPALFRGSILDNISMFRRVSQASAIAAARRLGLETVIQVIPEGYDTILGDVSAAALPLDVLQAICIARAVVMKPRLLLLDLRRTPPADISTRACDGAIKELRGETTIIVFGERMSEVEDADRIFLLEHSHLREIESTWAGSGGRDSGRKAEDR
jgi:ATP-binding cassette subfamily C protein LapB